MQHVMDRVAHVYTRLARAGLSDWSHSTGVDIARTAAIDRHCKERVPMHRILKAATLFIAAALPLTAEAASILDQEFVAPGAGFRFTSDLVATQTFTVGRDGLLDRVEVQLIRDISSTTGTITLSIVDATGGVFGATLTSVSRPVGDLST